MAQLRSVPPLDFYDKSGNSLLTKLPAYAKPFENFDESLRNFEEKWTLQKKLFESSKNLAPGAFDQQMFEQVIYPYVVTARWRDCLVQSLTAVNGKSPVFERFWWFWCNHFTVSTTNLEQPMIYGTHTRLIRDGMTESFRDLLYAAITSPAMVVYLDNYISTGPHSQAGHDPQIIKAGSANLNENLGRELLELHTVSPAAGYAQKDVTETALLLTGWQYYAGLPTHPQKKPGVKYGSWFQVERHEPGARTIMGKVYKPKGDGRNQLADLITDLASHPYTIKHLATKLARSFVADNPPQESIDRIAKVFDDSKGDLIAVHSAVVDEVMTYAETTPKFTTPINWLMQSYKATGADVPIFEPKGAAESIHFVYREMGETYDESPQPNGYSDVIDDWLSKAMIDRRVRQAYRIGVSASVLGIQEIGDYAARLAGSDSPLVSLVRRAESVPNAVAILLASPQFLFI